jgi:hypothetical protein
MAKPTRVAMGMSRDGESERGDASVPSPGGFTALVAGGDVPVLTPVSWIDVH